MTARVKQQASEKDVARARLLAASNHGMCLDDCNSVAQVMSWWWQGLSECGHSEQEGEDVMQAEVDGFLADLAGMAELPDCWKDIDEHLERMEG